MSTYTEFEALFLVGVYIVADQTGEEIVGAKAVIDRFKLEYKPNWIRRAISGFEDASLAKDIATLGDELEQDVWLTAAGVREAERLLDDEQVRVRMPSEAAQIAPASDRIVSINHNSEAATTARTALADLSHQLSVGNDVGELSIEEVEEAKREVWLLEQAIKQDAIRLDWIEPTAKACLKWIATKAAEQIVGNLAVAALAALAVLIGFSL